MKVCFDLPRETSPVEGTVLEMVAHLRVSLLPQCTQIQILWFIQVLMRKLGDARSLRMVLVTASGSTGGASVYITDADAEQQQFSSCLSLFISLSNHMFLFHIQPKQCALFMIRPLVNRWLHLMLENQWFLSEVMNSFIHSFFSFHRICFSSQ